MASMPMLPRVVDVSHHNVGTLKGGAIDFKAMAGAGIWGVIHKATQGRAYTDPLYRVRRLQATEAGLLWAAYHFNTGDPVQAQVESFLRAAQPDEHTGLVLDYEDNRLSNMSIMQALDFLHMVEERVGRKAAIYSGNRLKETLPLLQPEDRAYVCSHRLWLCQYGPKAVLPRGFEKYWIWQFTGDAIGPEPHSIAGVAGNGVDLNTFDGARDELAASWA
jgi:lysozyme